MREGLRKSNLKFYEQVSLYKNGSFLPEYIIDFVIFWENAKIAVEFDGKKYHKSNINQNNIFKYLLKNEIYGL